ncbi:MAG: HEAT repeat domain-containing protein [Anaerolineales bacterium]|uniref:HEAT repeat domain-containing protein n=1 Tax=Candidatus Villigracilis vicinus TaxID=3140679 RepID=UPI003134E4FE|nr:HEAT repeat domain-containing protein [Anaerolineales bacterium]MBK7451864.1 HEAT repeat domain-containing protein [Anaerolineales bacterium]MBK9781459.1 HEAT repeat domain-containing protein [Anaerolineales bacterium]
MLLNLIDPISFLAGFATATVLWFVAGRARPLIEDIRNSLKEQREQAQSRKSSTVEENHRRLTLRRAQGMHLAAQLFALDEILQEPMVITPPAPVEPNGAVRFEDIVTQTLPYLPTWPEIASVYQPHTLSLPTALAGDTNLVIIGQPGTGKSVALAHLASLAANRSEKLGALKDFVPFHFHVADLNLPVQDPKNVLNVIIDAASENAPIFDVSKISAFVQSVFKSETALLLVDGYDEITPDEQSLIAEFFKTLLKAHPKTRIVTTGAPEYLDGLIPLGFVPLALCTWSERSNQQFVDQWGELWSRTVALETWAQTGPEQVDALLINSWLGSSSLNLSPLELTLKVWGAYAGDSLGPHTPDAIATHIRRLAPANTPLAALETLAMQVVINATPVFDPRKAREWVKSFEVAEETPEGEAVQNPEEEAQEAPKAAKGKKVEKVSTPNSGLLGKMSTSGLLISYANNRMRFAHSILAGYLAGHAMTSYNAEETLINQPDWSGKFLTMRFIAAHGDASRLVQALLESSDLPMYRSLFAAARWLRDAPRTAPWRGKLFSTLASILQMEGIPLSLRGQAMAAFVYSNDSAAAPLFRQFAASGSFELVHLAILGLGAIRDIKSLKLLEAALNAPSLAVKRAACMALAAISTNESLEIVAHALLNGEEDVRRAAGEALANDPNEGHEMLRDGITINDILLRRAAIYGLGRVKEEWATDLLKKVQIEDEQWVVRNAATEVLEMRSHSHAYSPMKPKAPSETPWLIEFAAKKGVGVSPGVPATDILLIALQDETPEVRLAALQFLKYTPQDIVLKQMYEAMYKDDPELREAVYLVLWELGIAGIKLPHPSQYGLG